LTDYLFGDREACATGQTNSQASHYHLFMNGKKKRTLKPYLTNVLDYPCTMSGFKRESLAAEAKLKAEREKQKPPKRTVHD
jgi:hypothetical protein